MTSRDSSRQKLIDGTHHLMAAVSAEFTSTRKNIKAAARDGFRSPGEGGSSSGISDPTGQMALDPDEAEQDLDRHARIADLVIALVEELDNLRRKYKPAMPTYGRCKNMYGCPDDLFAIDNERCSSCAQYRRRHDGQDRKKNAA